MLASQNEIGVGRRCIVPGKPQQNGFIESFNLKNTWSSPLWRNLDGDEALAFIEAKRVDPRSYTSARIPLATSPPRLQRIAPTCLIS
jgi:transposase InsO family protein